MKAYKRKSPNLAGTGSGLTIKTLKSNIIHQQQRMQEVNPMRQVSASYNPITGILYRRYVALKGGANNCFLSTSELVLMREGVGLGQKAH